MFCDKLIPGWPKFVGRPGGGGGNIPTAIPDCEGVRTVGAVIRGTVEGYAKWLAVERAKDKERIRILQEDLRKLTRVLDSYEGRIQDLVKTVQSLEPDCRKLTHLSPSYFDFLR
jgi:hypothetical protein